MDPVIRSLILAFYLLLVGSQAAGYGYFAAIINKEVRPYFIAHRMDAEVANAGQTFGWLIASCGILGLSFFAVLPKICACGRSKSHEYKSGSSIGTIFRGLISLAAVLTLIVFACVTAAHALGWWDYFTGAGQDHLAEICHGLAAMMIICLVISGCSIAVMLGCLAVSYGGMQIRKWKYNLNLNWITANDHWTEQEH
ncbi:hypothetical protein GGR54DRAFT_242109 [Hypoxylon sp. NC1633]|nr:hypothetical protein GGR54DRAFT_242109 [Hypoxylon sp. NC1633]